MIQAYQKPLSGRRIGVVFGTFAPMHRGHLELIMRAKKENDGVIIVCCGHENDKGDSIGLPLWKRYQYVRELFAQDDLVAVHAIEDVTQGYAKENWTPWFKQFYLIMNAAGHRLEMTYWYVGEEEYWRDLRDIGINAVLVDRSDLPISATLIRKKPIRRWNMIAQPFRRAFSHNILVVGTASEGKSTLVSDLARYYGTAHAHEWARDYIAENHLCDWEFTCLDFMNFLIGQKRHIDEQVQSPENNGVFFSDTNCFITAMYARKYANDSACRMTLEEYERVILPMTQKIASEEKWDAIFMLTPGGKFVDDHTRFMDHSSLIDRCEMADHLLVMVEEYAKKNPETKVFYLTGGSYMANFEKIRAYAQEVYANG